MEKIRLLLSILIIILVAIGGVLGFKIIEQTITGATIQNVNNYSYTKAICDKNSCIDYQITCKNGELLDMKPLTEAVILPSNWQDPRTQEMIDRVC